MSDPIFSRIFNLIYPVGAIYISVNSTNPSTLFGGTWEQIQNRFLLACGSSYSNGSTGGNTRVTLLEDNLPSRAMVSTYYNGGLLSYSQWLGGNIGAQWVASDLADLGRNYDKAFSIMPPYLAVYVWKRTA